MLSKLAKHHRVVVAALVSSSCLSLGCRSSFRPLSMFARRSEPSAEALAGTGPTQTYPAPPSATTRPEAIASVAGGTAGSKNNPMTPGTTTKIASTTNSSTPDISSKSLASAPQTQPFNLSDGKVADVKPGYTTPVSGNMSAAQANGFYGTPQDASFPSTTPAPAMTSGYQFGKTAASLKTESTPVAKTETPSSFAVPSLAATPKTETPSSSPAMGGYAFPTEIQLPSPSNANADVKSIASTVAPPQSVVPELPKPNATPEVQTASIEPSSSNSSVKTTSGYTPGSTSGATSYPGSGGSFYR